MEKSYPLIEYKWRGVVSSEVSIPPAKNRKFDEFYFLKSFPKIIHLGINEGYTDYEKFYFQLECPGNFELTYAFFFREFSPDSGNF